MTTFVSRAQWGARAPRSRVSATLSRPSTGHWNGPIIRVGGQSKWDHSRCASLVRGIQNFHMDSRRWQDIAYNFLVCPHDYIFEGRGLNTANGANGTNAANRNSHAICVLAGEGNAFPVEEKRAFRNCVRHIADRTRAPDSCVGHRDHKATTCPGNDRYNWIRSGMPVSGGVTPPISYSPPSGSGKTPLVRLGNSGNAVRRVQQIIHDKAGGDIKVDGYFGPATKDKVRNFQRFFGLTVDGIVGPKTWGMLIYVEHDGNPPAAPAPAEPKFPPFDPAKGLWSVYPLGNKGLIRSGDRGDLVKYLQGVIAHKAGGNISIDGIFGRGTENRVKDVQHLFKLGADGIVGPKTWAVIDFMTTL